MYFRSLMLAPRQTFAWVVGINTTLSIFVTPLYGFGPKQIGFFYFTPIVAVILGEITGHWLHDLVAKQYIRSHNGHFEPEVRLRAIFLSFHSWWSAPYWSVSRCRTPGTSWQRAFRGASMSTES